MKPLLIWLLMTGSAWAQCWQTPVSNPFYQITRSASHQQLGEAIAATIQPINGKTAMMGIGMSASGDVFGQWVPKVAQLPEYVSTAQLYNGGQGSQGLEAWAETDTPWNGIAKPWWPPASDYQAFIVLLTSRDHDPDPVIDAAQYRARLQQVLLRIENDYPNVRIIYLLGMYFGGYDQSMEFLLEPQIRNETLEIQTIQDTWGGNAWIGGMTLWSDGATPNGNGWALECSDMASDGAHLSNQGKAKAGWHLHDLFQAESTAQGWLTVSTGPPPPPPPPPTLYDLFINGGLVANDVIWSTIQSLLDPTADTHTIEKVP